MRHFVNFNDLEASEIRTLLDVAQDFSRGVPFPRSLAGRTIANIFLEPSTRTRVSFELAARHLGGHVVSLDMYNSSFSKGESLLDTYRTLQAMGIDGFVVRTSEAGLPAQLSRDMGDKVAVFNAGEANVAHPTQGLLDVLTIRQYKPDIANLSIVIVGDVAHSRVARSTLRALKVLGCADLRIVAPPAWQPSPQEMPYARITSDLSLGLADCDVVMTLRIQNERLASAERMNVNDYVAQYRIDENHLGLAKDDAIVMHPGPVNRGVEISDAAADGPQSVILAQVRNGVFVRAAVFDAVARARGWIAADGGQPA